jgi:hypothetical protein
VLYRNGRLPFSGCRSQRAANLFSADAGRVCQQFKRDDDVFVSHAYACLFANASKRVDLGENFAPDATFEKFQLVGSLLAFLRGGCAMCVIDSKSIEVRDLRDGSVVRKAPKRVEPPWPDFLGFPAYFQLREYALKDSGSLAWTLSRASLGNGDPLSRREVWAFDAHGQRLLDVGPDIELESLNLNGSALSWVNAGAVRSTTLD